jgi:hypothetical protein
LYHKPVYAERVSEKLKEPGRSGMEKVYFGNSGRMVVRLSVPVYRNHEPGSYGPAEAMRLLSSTQMRRQ